MKKRLFFVVLVLFSAIDLLAQGIVFNKFEYRKNHDRSKAVMIGLKGGYTIYDMKFSEKNYDTLAGSTINKPAFGVFVEIPVYKKLTIAPELIMLERGMTKEYKWRNSINTTDKINAKYIDLRIPVIYRFLSESNVNPYVFAALDFAYCYGGEISKNYSCADTILTLNHLTNPEPVDISKSSAAMSQFDFSLLAGVGVRFDINFQPFSLVIKIDTGYNFGITDTYSKIEKEGNAVPENVSVYNSERLGKRYNRGFEAMLSIGLPLKFAEKGCSDFGNTRDRIY